MGDSGLRRAKRAWQGVKIFDQRKTSTSVNHRTAVIDAQ